MGGNGSRVLFGRYAGGNFVCCAVRSFFFSELTFRVNSARVRPSGIPSIVRARVINSAVSDDARVVPDAYVYKEI